MKISNFLHDLSLATKEFDLNYDCFSKGQLESKEWLVDIMRDVQTYRSLDFGTVFVLCGWYGILPAMMYLKGISYEKIRSFDIDDKCWRIADRINRTSVANGWKFKAATEDIFKIRFSGHMYKLWSYAKETDFVVSDVPDTIINTSCEHTSPDWFKYIPRQKIVVLQSNDFWDGDGHINCISSLNEFKKMFPLKDIYYEGQAGFPKYTRYTIIGVT